MPRLLLPLALLSLLLAGCAGLGLPEAAREDLTLAAADLGEQLEAPGLIAATAALLHEREGAYPGTPFGLLGSREAAETGLRLLPLSALTLTPEGDSLRIDYALVPTREDPSTHYGTLRLRAAEEAGRYVAAIVMEREDDPDVRPGPLPLAREGAYAVRRAQGRLGIDVAVVRGRAEAGERVGAPPMSERTTYTITFTPSNGLPTPEALAAGLSVTLPR